MSSHSFLNKTILTINCFPRHNLALVGNRILIVFMTKQLNPFSLFTLFNYKIEITILQEKALTYGFSIEKGGIT